MKKLITIMLAVALTLSLAACGNSAAPEASSAASSAVSSAAASTESKTAEATEAPAASSASSATVSSAAPAENDTAEAEATSAESQAASSESEAIEWPTRDVTVLVPFEVGSMSDVCFRAFFGWFSEKTGHQFIIENDGTGGGARLAEKLVNAEPDGYTIMVNGSNACNMYYQGLWDFSLADTSKVVAFAGAPGPDPYSGLIMYTNPDVPVTNFQELCDYINANPGQLSVGVTPGSAIEPKIRRTLNYFGLTDNVRIVSVDNAALTSNVLGGAIDIAFITEDVGLPYALDGSLNPMLNFRLDKDFADTYDEESLAMLQSIPTLDELVPEDELNDIFIIFRQMCFAPAGTPTELLEAMAAVIDSVQCEEGLEMVHSISPITIYSTGTLEEDARDMAAADAAMAELFAEN